MVGHAARLKRELLRHGFVHLQWMATSDGPDRPMVLVPTGSDRAGDLMGGKHGSR